MAYLTEIMGVVEAVFSDRVITKMTPELSADAEFGLYVGYRGDSIRVFSYADGSFRVEHVNRNGESVTNYQAFVRDALSVALRRVRDSIDDYHYRNKPLANMREFRDGGEQTRKKTAWSRVRSVFSSIINFDYYHTVFSIIWTFVGLYFISGKTDHSIAMGGIFLIAGLACAHEQRHNDMKKKVRDLENRLSRLDNRY